MGQTPFRSDSNFHLPPSSVLVAASSTGDCGYMPGAPGSDDFGGHLHLLGQSASFDLPDRNMRFAVRNCHIRRIVPLRDQDTSLIALCCSDYKVHLFNIAENRIVKSLEGHGYFVEDGYCLSDVLATCSGDGGLYFWKLPDVGSDYTTVSHIHAHHYHGGQVGVLRGNRRVLPTQILFAGGCIESETEDSEEDPSEPERCFLRLFDVTQQKTVREFRGHSEEVKLMAIQDGGSNQVLSTALDGSIRLWDLRTARCTNSFHLSSFQEHCHAGFWGNAEDQEHVFVAGGRKSVFVFDARRPRRPLKRWLTNKSAEMRWKMREMVQVAPDKMVGLMEGDYRPGATAGWIMGSLYCWDFQGNQFGKRIELPGLGGGLCLCCLKDGEDSVEENMPVVAME